MGFSIFLTSTRTKPKALDIVSRSSKLFLLGLFLNNGADWSHWRIPGVLQALGVAYFVVAFAGLLLPSSPSIKRFLAVHIAVVWPPLLLTNLLVTYFLRVPGCPKGYVGPGGVDQGELTNCTGGAHLYVDVQVFGRKHLFQTPTCQQEYDTGAYDPEGLLNWLMIAFTTHVGYCVAAWLVASDRPDRYKWLMGVGAVTFALSCVGVIGIPINKNVWSLTYALASSGFACWALTLATIIPSYPLTFVGRNAIAIYVMVRSLAL